jgi:cyclopropane fatty-acyl-phospholipid synthase-like methyltransferase
MVLELGCGSGANLWYLAREGFATTGIDGSWSALHSSRMRLEAEGLRAELVNGDFSELRDHIEPESYDAVIDVGALQHNRFAAVECSLDAVHATLRPGGSLFSMLVASGSWGDGDGRQIEPGTFADISEGPLVGMGVCHFFELEEVERLFARYSDVGIEYSERSLDGRQRTYRHWVVTATRP